jgi:amyloid beta precursor protein binding protein 1
VIVLGTTAAATETLKNLVLPGIGHFTIVDDHIVSERDLGQNFFVDSSSIGKPQCEVVSQFLLEMNPDVKGEGFNLSIKEFIDNHHDRIQSSQLVIACELTNSYASHLSALCHERNIPLILIRQYGMIAYLR